MILADSSVWIDHLRHQDHVLAELLLDDRITTHPFVVGEIALGNLRQRQAILQDMLHLPMVFVADDGEVLSFIDRFRLHGRGIGYVDCHLLAAIRLTPGTQLWTRDRRLADTASELGLTAPALPPGDRLV